MLAIGWLGGRGSESFSWMCLLPRANAPSSGPPRYRFARHLHAEIVDRARSQHCRWKPRKEPGIAAHRVVDRGLVVQTAFPAAGMDFARPKPRHNWCKN